MEGLRKILVLRPSPRWLWPECPGQVRKSTCLECVSVCMNHVVYPWYVRWIDVLMIVFLYRKDETEMETERTVSGWLPSLGAWWKEEGASRKDILSALVRLWPVLCYISLVACLRHEHMFLTSPFCSDHPLCLTTDPTRADTERRSDTCFSSPGTVAS